MAATTSVISAVKHAASLIEKLLEPLDIQVTGISFGRAEDKPRLLIACGEAGWEKLVNHVATRNSITTTTVEIFTHRTVNADGSVKVYHAKHVSMHIGDCVVGTNWNIDLRLPGNGAVMLELHHIPDTDFLPDGEEDCA